MIIRGIEQGSPEWFDLRCGIPTASEFSRIITGTTLKPSAQASSYRRELIAEWLGVAEPTYTSEWMGRGHDLENEATSWYQFDTGNELEKVAFVYGGDRKLYGCSPDALIGDFGGLEVKCPKASTHIEYLLDKAGVPSKYRPQVYGSLFVTGRDWWDFVSYHPRLDPYMTRVTKEDEDYLNWRSVFEVEINNFIDLLIAEREKLAKK